MTTTEIYGSADLSYGSSPECAADALQSLMSMLSEDYRCAGWYVGIERIVWDDLDKGELFDPVILSAIKLLATKCNGWWVWADDQTRLVPLDEWRRKWAASPPPSQTAQS
jgi:hypothetical protein